MEIIQSPLIERVLTAEEQKRLSPDDVLNGLKEGNKRFTAGNLTLRDHSKQIFLCRQVFRPDDRVNSPVVRVLTKCTAFFCFILEDTKWVVRLTVLVPSGLSS
ncbi:MAG: hypothetical protein ACK498_18760 [Cyclobacteriaceae bacterium]